MKNGELGRRLRDLREPAPPAALRARLEDGIPGAFRQRDSGWRQERVWMLARIGAFAATVTVVISIVAWFVMGFVIGPGGSSPAYAALLEPVAVATGEAPAAHLVLSVRTRPGEDFPFVNVEGDLQKVEVWIREPVGAEARGRARVEKADRIYCFDGVETVFYQPRSREAYRAPGMYGGLDLFWPSAWVREIQSGLARGVQGVSLDERGGTRRLVLREKAAELHPSARPSFFQDFDRETEIEWDPSTHRLTGLKRWIVLHGERRLFMELESVEYPPAIDERMFRLELPPDVRWVAEKEAPAGMEAMGPADLARKLFDAAIARDRVALEAYCPYPSMVDELLGENGPSQIYYVGEPYHSGSYAGVYVPYKVRFGKGPSSRVKEFQMAVRNDNPRHQWVFDGGI